jgi:hypothetical protein
MSEGNLVEFIEEWQTVAGLILASALGGGLIAVVFGMRQQAILTLGGLVIGGMLTFAVLSYLLYGR